MKVGQIIKYIKNEENVIERILWIDNEKKIIVTIRLDNVNEKRIQMPNIYSLDEYNNRFVHGEIQVITVKQDKGVLREDSKILKENTALQSDSSELERDRERAIKEEEIINERWKCVKDLVKDEPAIYYGDRGTLINKEAEKLEVSVPYIYMCLTAYWRAGKNIEGLRPNFYKCGGKGKRRFYDGEYGNINRRLTKEVSSIIERSYKKFYLDIPNATLNDAYIDMLNQFFVKVYKQDMVNGKVVFVPVEYVEVIPSLYQFKRWGKAKYDIKYENQKKHGMRTYNLKDRPAVGGSTNLIYGPGYSYQIDSTIGDIQLVDEYTGLPIGKPIIYIVVDAFSRYIVAVHVGLQNASWESASMAIYNIVRDHAEFVKEYNIKFMDGQWENAELPQVLVADNAELCSYLNESLVSNLWTGIELMAPYRPDWKSIVERKMRQLNDLGLKDLPGSTYNYKNQRGEKNPRKEAKMTLKSITKIIIEEVIEANNRYMPYFNLEPEMIKDNVKPIATEIWKWGLENRTGYMATFSDEQIKLNLMYSKTVSLTGRGVRLYNSRYTNEVLQRQGVFDELLSTGSKQIVVHFDTRNMQFLYFIHEGEIIALHAVDKAPLKMYFEEMKDYWEKKKAEDKEGANHNALLHGQKKAYQKAEEIKNNGTLSNSELKNVRSNREGPKQEQREKEASIWKIADTETKEQTEDKVNNNSCNSEDRLKNLIRTRKRI